MTEFLNWQKPNVDETFMNADAFILERTLINVNKDLFCLRISDRITSGSVIVIQA